jgi:sugar lactone lactonase YvrE
MNRSKILLSASRPRRLLLVLVTALAVAGCSGATATGTPVASGPGGSQAPRPSNPSASESTAPASSFETFGPQGLVWADGHLYASDCEAARVYLVEPASLTEVAGSGPGGFAAGFSGDGGPATQAQLQCPIGLAFDAAGDLLIVAHGNNRIRQVDPDGIITTIAGTGPSGTNQGTFGGDGGPATEANLQEPTSIAIAPDGTIYIADRDNDRIRRIDPSGVMSTFAGDGTTDYRGDGGPATEAGLDDPAGLAIGPDGSLYFADSNHHVVRRVNLEGTIETIAGTGTMKTSGDGGPATAAELEDPESVIVDAAGNLYIGDASANLIRRVSPDGVINAFAGTGEQGLTGDGGPATAATLRVAGGAAGLAIDDAGRIYIADTGNHCIRVVETDGTISTFAPA